jgi:predicted nuclease of predicted toxin-antitoxin system
MKVLLDTCVWKGARTDIEAAGHDAIWAGDWDNDPGDMEILDAAHRERRVLITLDKDFGELAFLLKMPHCGIIRLVNVPARQQGQVRLRILEQYGDDLLAGAIITLAPGRLRIRYADRI